MSKVVWLLAIGAVAVTFLNPGGLIVGLLIALVLLAGRYGLPFVGKIYLARQQGMARAKIEQKARDSVRGTREFVDDTTDRDRRGGRR